MVFKILFARFMVAYKETFLGDVKARKATLDMINLASAAFRLYMTDLINDKKLREIQLEKNEVLKKLEMM